MTYYSFIDENTYPMELGNPYIGDGFVIANPTKEIFETLGLNPRELIYGECPMIDYERQSIEEKYRIEGDKIIQYFNILNVPTPSPFG